MLVQTYLHLNVQNTCPSLLSDRLDRLHAGTVVVAAELRMLDECILRNELSEVFYGREVIGDTLFLTVARRASRMRDGEAEAVGVGLEETFQ
jgi:hypothetical protein